MPRAPLVPYVLAPLAPLALGAPAAAQVAERATDPASGATYLRTPEPLDAFAADALARELGGHLVALGSPEEETFVLDNFGAEEGYWIGLESPRDVWASGEPVAHARWAAGEPSGGAAETFTVMNWGEPGAWGDAAGDVEGPRWRALIELAPGTPAPARVPETPRAPPAARGVLVCAIQGLEARDLQASRNRNLHALWERSAWTFDAGGDLSGDPLAGLGLVLWGVGSDRSGLTSADPRRGARGTESLLARLERARTGVSTAALLDDPALAGLLLDGRMDLRASNASPRRGGTSEPVAAALALPAPLCVVAAWTSLAVPGAAEPAETSRAREIAAIDAELGALLDALGARPRHADEEWLVVVTGLAPVHGKQPPAPEERARTGVPLCLVAPGVAPGELRGEVLLADVVPTALRHLGVEPRRSFALDGRALELARDAAWGADLVANGGAEAQLGFATGAPSQLAGWRQLAPFVRARHAADAPPELGQAYFRGGGGGLARAEQRLDLGAFGDGIARGAVRFRFAASLRAGGGTTLECALELLDERGRELERVALAPEEGAGGWTAHAAAGGVPRRTRAARIVLLARGADTSAAAADGVALVLERAE